MKGKETLLLDPAELINNKSLLPLIKVFDLTFQLIANLDLPL